VFTAPQPMTTVPWMIDGTALFTATLAGLTDAQLAEPSTLPGWSRAHVVGHLGLNAQALGNLVEWARTGEPHSMYASAQQRDADIEASSGWPAATLRRFVADTAADLDTALDGLDADSWHREVVNAQGAPIPASDIPWMRTREVYLHAIDLAGAASFADLPDDFCAALVADVVARRAGRGSGPALRLEATDGHCWEIGNPAVAVLVRGNVAGLAQWLSGRGTAGLPGAVDLPELDRWL
jgi:maleylpyruvate isomerase